MSKVIWILVSSNNISEARKIGRKLLRERLIACYSLTPKLENTYYWPPKSGKLESSTGPQLILETLPTKYRQASQRIKKLHSDKVPFIGKLVIDEVDGDFYNWMKRELKH